MVLHCLPRSPPVPSTIATADRRMRARRGPFAAEPSPPEISEQAPMINMLQKPIFVGGTGRSGTSIMANLLNSHSDIVLPTHENKIIVEKFGLRDLVDQIGGRFDMKRNHYAIADFIRWARKLRTLGFRDQRLNDEIRSLTTTGNMGFHRACEIAARAHPEADLSIHAIGHAFGLTHYDKCANTFINKICEHTIIEGLVDTEGLLKPFFLARPMDRSQILESCREFLDELYTIPIKHDSAKRWCDDTPSNWLYCDFLYELYPDMRFIHMIRDPRDVVASYVKQVWAPADPRAIVSMFKSQYADYEDVKRTIPAENIKEIRIEDIAIEGPRVMDELSAFLGLENRFDLDLFINDKANTGAHATLLECDVVDLIERELSEWMQKHRYLS